MHVTIDQRRLELTRGDITDQEVDAIVNAANEQLAGGSGVDGAIHRRGGPAIMEETRRRYPDGCPTGNAVISSAGELPCRAVLHAVGPVWEGGDRGEPELLRGAHQRCLELAVEHGLSRVAFPALSTGAYGYPIELAAPLALTVVRDFLRREEAPQLVRFVLFRDDQLAVFEMALAALTAQG